MTSNSKLHTLLRRSRTALHYGRKNGVGALVALTLQKLRGNGGGLLAKARVIEHYGFVHNHPVGSSCRT